jgi:probable HAF family extracellular repeat protein
MYLLGRLGGHFSGANDINNYGQIVGYSGSDDGSVKSFLWQPVEPGATSGSMIELPALPLGSGGQAFGINARGVVTGWADIEGFPHAFLWISDMPNGIHGQIVDLGRLPGGDVSIGRAVNSGGQVAGEATSPEGDRAFLWSPVSGQPGAGTMIDLGSLGGPASGAYGINDSGQVVGFSSDVSGLAIAFLYTGGTMHDLNALLIEDYDGVTLRAAFDINELGDIVGVAEVNGEGHAFLLTPTDRER